MAKGKQAIVLIHGIGEQKPMESLRRFVHAVWTTDKCLIPKRYKEGPLKDQPTIWSKPDRFSKSFELKRITTIENSKHVKSDFFEFYWAHLMYGTTLNQVIAWAKTLLLRKPNTVPKQLLPSYFLLFSALLISISFLIYAIVAGIDPRANLLPAWLSALISVLILPAIIRILSSIVGDAARYLYPAPTNIHRRHEIREAGVSLIHKLHRQKYDRIVVVGHSLGSVIGYDILTHAWVKYNKVEHEPGKPLEALDELEKLALELPDDHPLTADDIQSAQRKYFKTYREIGGLWRVTDFITLGSPLAHAPILLAKDESDLKQRQIDREFPRCLPVLEKRMRDKIPVRRFSYQRRKSDKKRVLHHAAVFAPTCWTNLYFPNKLIIFGDIVGGPLASVFGKGIKDIPVSTKQRWGFLTHTFYWRAKDLENAPPPPHIQTLRNVLDIADDKHQISRPEKKESINKL